MFVQAEVNLGAGRSLLSLPASAISYAPYGDSVFIVSDLKGQNGETYHGVRQQFVKLEGARGDQVAVISGVKPGDEVVTSVCSSCGTVRRCSSTTRSSPGTIRRRSQRTTDMRFTDLFIKRPVLAIVVNLVILIAGLQSIRALSVRQYPRSDIAVVRVTTAYIGANADLVRGIHHDAARARHRQRRRHRLHGVVERPGSEHDHRAPEAQLRHQRRADADSGEGGSGAQRSAARGRGAKHRAGNRGQPVRGDVSSAFRPPSSIQSQITDYLTRVVQPKLSAISGVQRADILGDRTFAMRIWLKPDQDGGSRDFALGGAGGAGEKQLPLGARHAQRDRWCR